MAIASGGAQTVIAAAAAMLTLFEVRAPAAAAHILLKN